jgi:hypothetical protein
MDLSGLKPRRYRPRGIFDMFLVLAVLYSERHVVGQKISNLVAFFLLGDLRIEGENKSKNINSNKAPLTYEVSKMYCTPV